MEMRSPRRTGDAENHQNTRGDPAMDSFSTGHHFVDLLPSRAPPPCRPPPHQQQFHPPSLISLSSHGRADRTEAGDHVAAASTQPRWTGRGSDERRALIDEDHRN
jgi:hypothetical protein